jgi:hypothetical protein
MYGSAVRSASTPPQNSQGALMISQCIIALINENAL